MRILYESKIENGICLHSDKLPLTTIIINQNAFVRHYYLNLVSLLKREQ